MMEKWHEKNIYIIFQYNNRKVEKSILYYISILFLYWIVFINWSNKIVKLPT